MRLSAPGCPLRVNAPSRESAWSFVGLFVTVLLLASGIGWGQVLTPPAPPLVAPVISGHYPGDTDGDRIDDVLAEISAASPRDAGKAVGTFSADEASIAVELIFNEAVTQSQIDAFLAAGGEITYLYKSVSYGWNGRIAPKAIASLPAIMGPSLVLVESVRELEPYMDMATRTGRVRPIWQPGFAGTVAGFDGDPSITIGFVVDGVDGTHPDLAGRCAYWSDFSGADESDPVDYLGHGSLSAGVAVGTGEADTLVAPALKYTYVGDYSSPQHVVDPISFISSTYVEVKSEASWVGGEAVLAQIRWIKGEWLADLDWIGRFVWGSSYVDVTNSYLASQRQVFSTLLDAVESSHQDLSQVVITNSVSLYPSINDGFPRFRGVAPACRWASTRVDVYGEWDEDSGLSQSLDDLVQHREAHNIKIINISHGLVDENGPSESQSMRDKVNSAVRSGIVVVSAAGNSADYPFEEWRKMADPPRAALAITVGATNDENELTYYSSYGYTDPDHEIGEDYKPDLVAPGGSIHQTGIMSVDTGFADGLGIEDKQPDDYTTQYGTSFASPFVAGCAALIIDAMQQQGTTWDFHSDEQPRFVKMLLCATASETNAKREEWHFSPTLERASAGPEGFPRGKDRYEGYGVINAEAAVEAVCQTYVPGTSASEELGAAATDRRVWARSVNLVAGSDIDVSLDNPTGGDFDLYLYDAVPSDTGTPIILVSSARVGKGVDEFLTHTPDMTKKALLVVKRVSGAGTFELLAEQAGPPTASDVAVTAGHNAPVTVTLAGMDDGSPNPPGQLSYVVQSLPEHGQLEHAGTGAAILHVPAALGEGVDQVVYRPDTDWTGEDAFTFRADDGGTAPGGGHSNVATVSITIVADITQVFQVASEADDAGGRKWSTYQKLNEPALAVGQEVAGMRFRHLEIPQGARIIKATLKLCSYTSDLRADLTAVIHAEAADDVDEFGSDHRVSGATTTNASQVWQWESPAWSSNTWYESPDISQVIQEVVDRSGWSTSSSIAILCSADGYASTDRRFWSYDGNSDNAVQLEITYQP
jgi:Subtilase family